jgi:hypothetical protein
MRRGKWNSVLSRLLIALLCISLVIGSSGCALWPTLTGHATIRIHNYASDASVINIRFDPWARMPSSAAAMILAYIILVEIPVYAWFIAVAPDADPIDYMDPIGAGRTADIEVPVFNSGETRADVIIDWKNGTQRTYGVELSDGELLNLPVSTYELPDSPW